MHSLEGTLVPEASAGAAGRKLKGPTVMSNNRVYLCASLVAIFCVAAPVAGEVRGSNVAGKKLIRAGGYASGLFGAESMSELDMPAKVKQWQTSGLDGLVFVIVSHDRSKGYHQMTGQWWAPIRRTYDEFLPEIKAFQSVKDWGRITENFSRTMHSIWSDPPAPPAPDWFNDEHWDIVLHNARVLARVSKDCSFRGIMLDTEQYAHHGRGPWRFPFNYKLYADGAYQLAGEKQPRSFEQCQAKVFERAKQYAQAITEEFPDLVLFVIPGLYDTTWRLMTERHPGGKLRDCAEALYPSFVDGLLVGLDERATLVAGTESTYSHSQYKDMLVVRDVVKQQSLCMSGYPDLARKRITYSAGIWTDSGWGPDRFSHTDSAVNQRNPQRHKHAVHNALAASDEYAWQWAESSRFLMDNPTPLIREYLQANIDGHEPQDLNWQPVPKWDMADYTQHDKEMATKDTKFWADADKGGWRVAVELPEYWHIFFDVEHLIRMGSHMLPGYDYSSWPLMSIRRCWQSQSIKANGLALYRTRFDAPADIDPDRQEIALAVGAFLPDDPKGAGWMDVSLNGKGYPIRHLMDVSKAIKPGESNELVIRVINHRGPSPLTGSIKLLVRGGAKAMQAPDPNTQTVFSEDFEGYDSGTLLTDAGWTGLGDIAVTTLTTLGKSTKAIDGATAKMQYARAYKNFTRPINVGDSVTCTAKVYHTYGGSWAHVGMRTDGTDAVMVGNNGWTWSLDARAIGANKIVNFWPWSRADSWARPLTAAIHVDVAAHKVWATLTDAHGTEHSSDKLVYTPGAEAKLTGAWVLMANTQAGKNMDIDEIKVQRAPRD